MGERVRGTVHTDRVIAEVEGDESNEYLLRVDDETFDIIGRIRVLHNNKQAWKNRGVGYWDLFIEPAEASLDTVRDCYDEWSVQNPWTYQARDQSMQTAFITLVVTKDDQE